MLNAQSIFLDIQNKNSIVFYTHRQFYLKSIKYSKEQ